MNNLTELHEELKALFSTYLRESDKFDNGVKVSAVRARQALNDLKTLIPERRKEIQEQKKDLV